MHIRKSIREQFRLRLLGTAPEYATPCRDRVFSTMTPPVALESLVTEGPVLLVYVRHDESREEDYPVDRSDGSFARRMEVVVEVLATGAMVDDTLDDLAEQIEALIENWEIPGFPAADPLLVNTQINVADSEDRIFGGLYMTYHMKVHQAYREDTSEGWMPDSVHVIAKFTLPPEQIVFPEEGD